MAILLVVAGHTVAAFLPNGGRVGVTLFFVLSGFLITRLLVRELDDPRGIALRAFWARRARRLVPAFAVFLPVAIGVLLARSGGDPKVLLLLLASPVMNVLRVLGGDQWAVGHLWSLAVEEQFYIVWPLLLTALSRGGNLRKRLRLVTIVLVAWHCVLPFMGLDTWSYFGPDANAYALVMGAFLGTGAGSSTQRPFRAICALLVIALAAAYPFSGTAAALSQPVVALAGCLLLCNSASLHLLGWTGLGSAGRVSYGWYLWHVPMLELSLPFGIWAGLMADLASLGVAALSFRYVESRFMTAPCTPKAKAPLEPQGV